MELIEVINNRYTVKKFDKEKKISAEDFEKIKELLRLSPSSVNIQPWKFLIAKENTGLEKIAKSTKGFEFNTNKVVDAQVAVVFCTTKNMNEEHLDKVLLKEEADGRFANDEIKAGSDDARNGFYGMHKSFGDDKEWLEKQVYLNIGHFVLGCAQLGIDSVIMEGIDKEILDQEFNLDEQNLRSTVVVGLGYRSDDDFNAKLPKSRLDAKDVITIID